LVEYIIRSCNTINSNKPPKKFAQIIDKVSLEFEERFKEVKVLEEYESRYGLLEDLNEFMNKKS
jgi:hypothetical protein